MKRTSRQRRRRSAFTLLELLVVVAIIGVLIALLMPAVQKVRAAAARTSCSNNLRQMGIALHHFNDQYRHFPSGGEGSNPSGTPYPRTYFDLHSVFTLILPFVEHSEIYDRMDLHFAYNDTVAPNNQVAAKAQVKLFLCPSNPLRDSGNDPSGYGYTDYGATVYTDIDPSSGVRNRKKRADGALHATSLPMPPGNSDGAADTCTYVAGMPWTNASNNRPYDMIQLGTNVSSIGDGLSCTIAIAEDVGRQPKTQSPYGDPVPGGGAGPNNLRQPWRWADPNCAFGVSGDPMSTSDQMGGKQPNYGGIARAINNNSSPIGGGTCDWNLGYAAPGGPPPLPGYTGGPNNNCGPNNEIFSFHGGGANAVFMDGHVSFLSEEISPVIVRYLVTANEGTAVPADVSF